MPSNLPPLNLDAPCTVTDQKGYSSQRVAPGIPIQFRKPMNLSTDPPNQMVGLGDRVY